jgi:hypothetical protein
MPVRRLPFPFGPQYAGFVKCLYLHALESHVRNRSAGQTSTIFNGRSMDVASARRQVASAQAHGRLPPYICTLRLRNISHLRKIGIVRRALSSVAARTPWQAAAREPTPTPTPTPTPAPYPCFRRRWRPSAAPYRIRSKCENDSTALDGVESIGDGERSMHVLFEKQNHGAHPQPLCRSGFYEITYAGNREYFE